jgi:hypothetical protein
MNVDRGKDRRPLPGAGEKWALAAVVIVLLPLAFSAEILEAVREANSGRLIVLGESDPRVLLVGMDLLLLLLILGLVLALWRVDSERPLGRTVIGSAWLIAGLGTLALDYFYTATKNEGAVNRDGVAEFWISAAVDLGYVFLAAILFAIAMGVNPGHLVPGSRLLFERTGIAASRARFRPVVPLLVGTLAAYFGGEVWDFLLEDGSGRGNIDQQFFAQASQVIPLLLVALTLEANFFKDRLQEPTQRAVTIVTVLVLCVGEVLAISALSRSNETGELLNGWHEYIAFMMTLEAIFVALSTLVWAALPEAPDRPATQRESGLGLQRTVPEQKSPHARVRIDTPPGHRQRPSSRSIAAGLVLLALGWRGLSHLSGKARKAAGA